MSDLNQVRLGRENIAGTSAQNATANRELYLDLFSGEVFKGFQHNSIARDLVMKRTLKNGKSLQFIYTGRTKATYHTPGTPILGNSDQAPPVAERTITVDDLWSALRSCTSWMRPLLITSCVVRSLARSATPWLRPMTGRSSVLLPVVLVLLALSLPLTMQSLVVLRSV